MELLLRVLLGLIRDAPRHMSNAQWDRFVRALYPLMIQARRGSIEDAARMLAREAALHDGDIADPFEPFYDLHALDSVLTRTVREPLNSGEPVSLIETASQAAVERHVANAGREAVAVASENTPGGNAPLGWARRLTGAENCGFCVMLASRGAVYKFEHSAKYRSDMRRFHDGCDCEVVPVYDLNDWPGLDGFIEANRRYRAALGHVDGKGDDVLKALRRDLYATPFELPARAA